MSQEKRVVIPLEVKLDCRDIIGDVTNPKEFLASEEEAILDAMWKQLKQHALERSVISPNEILFKINVEVSANKALELGFNIT